MFEEGKKGRRNIDSMIDFEGRASRRPMPRRLEVSDWNVDSDVRSGVSSSLARYPATERATSETRAAPTDPSRRLLTGNELRPAATAILRPVNRYDIEVMTTARASGENSGSVSSWRTSGAFMQRTERTEERRATVSVPAPRLQPRNTSIQDSRRHTSGSTESYSSTHSSVFEDIQSRRSAWDRETRASRLDDTPSSRESESTIASYLPQASSPYFSPPRSQPGEPTTPATVYSDASTDVMSPPFTASITDTPSTDRSSTRTPPFTPASDDTPPRRQYSRVSPSTAPYAAGEVSSDDSSPETDAAHDRETTSEPVIPATRPCREMNSSSRTSSLIPGGMSPQQQREQLYDFRRDMRQVFARVDEMVDMHRDMFKSDPMPQFDTTTARETASFTSETFEQLTALRAKFEALARAWTPQDESQSESSSLSLPHRAYESRQRPSPSDETSSTGTMRNSSHIASSESMETIEPPSSASSVSSSSPTAASASHRMLGLGRQTPIPRWEPTLSSLSNRSASSSSSSASSESSSPPPSEQSSLPSTTRPVFRPAIATPRMNVFEDFDKRMEEIRASLNSIARDRPRVSAPASSPSQSSSTSSSWALSTSVSLSTANKFRSCDDTDSCSDHEPATLENSSRASNRIHQPASNESRKDREARLRQLLRELRETGDDGDDDDAD